MFIRGARVANLPDCVVSETEEENDYALEQMQKVLKATPDRPLS